MSDYDKIVHRLNQIKASIYIAVDESVADDISKSIANGIDELQRLRAENEALRKDAQRWQAILHSQSYCPSDFGNPIGFAGRLGQYSDEEINASVDKYIGRAMKG